MGKQPQTAFTSVAQMRASLPDAIGGVLWFGTDDEMCIRDRNKETAHLSEICFIRHLLDGLSDGARCVVIVPQSTMTVCLLYTSRCV